MDPKKVKSMDKIYSKVLENDFDVSYDEFVQYLRLVFKLLTVKGRCPPVNLNLSLKIVIAIYKKKDFSKLENPKPKIVNLHQN